uniref:Uncharacterized protein n=1 Tax=Rhizophora mucronata TaxID=61149 RepID=A0A2P2QKF2_RHIMU
MVSDKKKFMLSSKRVSFKNVKKIKSIDCTKFCMG